ncbi:hypothetical protein V502_00053 [Pseudogymnoascus sp. VKM F-4520 (FW-2644)]|nr:hypothetical protein V502_00053 [Pseudogymnoascus sp. VKM F-4520 (FW-2644)]
MLPPLNSLDLLKGQLPAPQHIHQYQAPPRFRQRREQQREQHWEQHREQHGELHREHYNHHSSPSGSSSTSHRRSGSNSPTPSSHSNVPYTLEQVHFIQYYREDKNIQWQAIVDPFKAQFPRVVFPQSNEPNGPKGPDRQKGALECRYYRAQMYPKIDDGGNFVFDQNGDVEWMNIKVRDRNNYQHISILQEYFKLVTRCPEEVLTYSWTDENDKKEAKRIIEGRAMQGRGRLLGGLIRVRPTL